MFPLSALSNAPPYPWSDFDIEFDLGTYYTPLAGCRGGRAPQCLGDNWPVALSDAGIFTVWGDGVGPGGKGRNGLDVSLGVARLSEDATLSDSSEVYLGAIKDQRCRDKTIVDDRLCGKSYSIIAHDDRLLMWVSPGSGRFNYASAELFYSDSQGQDWQSSAVKFGVEEMVLPVFAQFPLDYAGEHDDFFYVFGTRAVDTENGLVVQRPGEIVAYRVKKKFVHDRDRYESLGVVFRDKAGGVGWSFSVAFDQSIDRFVLMTEHNKTMQSKLGVFVAQSPTGPWKVVAYYDNWAREIGLAPIGSKAFHWNMFRLDDSADQFVVVFSGIGNDDTFQTLRARWKRR